MRNNIWLIGLGEMGIEYSKVLKNLGAGFIAIGRGEISSHHYEKIIFKKPITGGLSSYLDQEPKKPDFVIVTVGVDSLYPITDLLVKYGVRKILLEKPGGIDKEQINSLYKISKQFKSKIFVAYNRRFYSSSDRVLQIIKGDGGVKSFSFDFTEIIDKIKESNIPMVVKEKMLLANSTHVIDLAFYLCGKPDKISTFHKGALD